MKKRLGWLVRGYHNALFVTSVTLGIHLGCVVPVHYAEDVEDKESDKTQTQALVCQQHIPVARLKGRGGGGGGRQVAVAILCKMFYLTGNFVTYIIGIIFPPQPDGDSHPKAHCH